MADPLSVESRYRQLTEKVEMERSGLIARVEAAEVASNAVCEVMAHGSTARRVELLEAELLEAKAACLEYQRRWESAKEEIMLKRKELSAQDGRIETLLGLCSGRDQCIVFDKSDVIRDDLSLRRRGHRGKIVVARFPKESGEPEEHVLQEIKAACKADMRVDRLEAALAAQSAAFDNFRVESTSNSTKSVTSSQRREDELRIEARGLATQLTETTRALIDCKSQLLLSQTQLERKSIHFAKEQRELRLQMDDLRACLRAEFIAARSALAVELEAATCELKLQRDKARRDAKEARELIACCQQLHQAALAKAKRRIIGLRASLKQLARQRALDREGYNCDVANLKLKLLHYKPPSGPPAAVASKIDMSSSSSKQGSSQNLDNFLIRSRDSKTAPRRHARREKAAFVERSKADDESPHLTVETTTTA